jgi:hypothetical protein
MASENFGCAVPVPFGLRCLPGSASPQLYEERLFTRFIRTVTPCRPSACLLACAHRCPRLACVCRLPSQIDIICVKIAGLCHDLVRSEEDVLTSASLPRLAFHVASTRLEFMGLFNGYFSHVCSCLNSRLSLSCARRCHRPRGRREAEGKLFASTFRLLCPPMCVSVLEILDRCRTRHLFMFICSTLPGRVETTDRDMARFLTAGMEPLCIG